MIVLLNAVNCDQFVNRRHLKAVVEFIDAKFYNSIYPGYNLNSNLQNFQYLCHKPNSHYREQCLP